MIMSKETLNSILHKPGVFYTLGFAICALGIYIARFIQDKYKIFAEGFVGLAVFYLIYLTFLSRKNISSKPFELEDLEFPKDINYLFFGFFWAMIIYWAAGQILDLVRYFIYGIGW
jgi:hypothetical protein